MKPGVLLFHHGAVDRAEDIGAFVANVRHGRPAPPAVVEEVTRRWLEIGGSPLNAIVRAQGQALAARMNLPVAIAGRLWDPYPKDVVPSLVAQGVDTIVCVPLAPYSVRVYHAAAKQACDAAKVALVEAAPWGTNASLVDGFAHVIEDARATLGERGNDAHLLLTAHSLPTRIIQSGDTYEREVRATFDAVLKRLEFPADRALLSYQSQGMDGGDWLGPDLPTAFVTLKERGARAVVVCAIGFLADHTEVLYDLDIEARAIAEGHGMSFARAASLNVRKELIDALDGVTRDALSRI